MQNKKKIILILFIIVIMTFNWYGCSRESEDKPDFLVRESDYYIPDEIAGHIHKPHAKRKFKWDEHEKGKILMQTNNLGFREDKYTHQTKSEEMIRVLVTGDSHIDGVLYNSESFPNLLEKALNSRYKTPRFEIINGGTGYYGPQNYLGFLKKYIFLKPDMFIVVIYTGNDFLAEAQLIENENHVSLERPNNYYTLLNQGVTQNSGAIDQALNQTFYFKTFPYMMDKVIENTQKQVSEINDLCVLHEIGLLVILLPTKLDVEWESDAQRLEKAKEALELTDKDLKINRILTERISAWLTENEIESFDLFTQMQQQQKELFWKQDYHLNTNGHRLVANTLFKLFLSSFEQLIKKEQSLRHQSFILDKQNEY